LAKGPFVTLKLYSLLGINDQSQSDDELLGFMLITSKLPIPAMPRSLMTQPANGEANLTWDGYGLGGLL
jgi:hypothetical protein